MKQQALRIVLCLSLLLAASFAYKGYSQVTVGANTPPAKAAILEIRDTEQPNTPPTAAHDVSNATAWKGGLGLPRVQLVKKNTLEPFIGTGDNDWINATTSFIKEKHAGLVVYNLAITTDGLKPGVYVWDGAKWATIGGGQQYFYIPSFNVPLAGLAIGNSKTIDFYDEYFKQFTKSGNTTFVSSDASIERIPSPGFDRLYNRDELEYVVTYYDQTVMTNVVMNNGVSVPADKGKLTFDLLSLEVSPNSFLNVVFVIK